MIKTNFLTKTCLLASLLTAGCAAQDALSIPESTPTMLDIFHRSAVPRTEARQDLNSQRFDDIREQVFENPDSIRYPVLHVYVFPQQDTRSGFLTPGHWTVLPLVETPNKPELPVVE